MTQIRNPQWVAMNTLIRRAREHQLMNVQFESYGELLAYLRSKKDSIDEAWHLKVHTLEELHQLRGQKVLLLELISNFEGELQSNIDEMTRQLGAIPEYIENKPAEGVPE